MRRFLLVSALLVFQEPAVFASELGSFGNQYKVQVKKQGAEEKKPRPSDGDSGVLGALVEAAATAPAAHPSSEDSEPLPPTTAMSLELGVHEINGSPYGGLFRARFLTRFGADLAWTGYTERADQDLELDLFRLAGLAALPLNPRVGLIGGAGVMMLNGENKRTGPLALGGVQWRPWLPLAFAAEGVIGAINGRPLWDLRAWVGLNVGLYFTRFGWRGVYGPSNSLKGPEFSVGLGF